MVPADLNSITNLNYFESCTKIKFTRPANIKK